LGAACATSVAAAQSGQDTARQRAKVQPKTTPQQSGKSESGPRGWRNVKLDGGIPTNAAEKASAAARLDEIDRIVLTAAPEFGHLSYPTWSYSGGFSAVDAKANTILEYRYQIAADLGGRGLCVIFEVQINPTMRGTPGEPIVEAHMGKPVPGAYVTWNNFLPPPDPSWQQVVLVRDGESPYIQLTREEVRRWQIRDEEGSNGEKLAERKKLLANTPYERFMADAPERKKNRDDLRAALKGIRSPAEIDAQIKEMEDAERQAAADLKAQDKSDRHENDSLSRAQSTADKARASIARMTPAERKLPAYVRGEASDTLWNFGTADSPFTSRVVRPNPSFWTMHRSRVEVRSMLLDFSAACPKEPPPPEVHAALWKLRQNIDWAALKRMMNQP
jgi:hypothetical protein